MERSVLVVVVRVIVADTVYKLFDLGLGVGCFQVYPTEEAQESPAEASVDVCDVSLATAKPMSAVATLKRHLVYLERKHHYDIVLMVVVR